MSSLALLGRLAKCCIRNKSIKTSIPVRNGSSGQFKTYRDQVREHPLRSRILPAVILWVVVVWSGVHMYEDPGHWLLGEFPQVDPSKFTDEELGIPPDDEDIYPPGYTPIKDRQ